MVQCDKNRDNKISFKEFYTGRANLLVHASASARARARRVSDAQVLGNPGVGVCADTHLLSTPA